MYRESKGINIVGFAKTLGISQGSLSDIENNKTKPSAEPVGNLIQNTDINVYWLFSGEGEMLRKGPDDTYIYKDALDPDPEVAKLLTMTREVLKSDTDYAASLAANIRSFHRSVQLEGEIHDLKACVQDHGKRLASVEKLKPGESDPPGENPCEKNDPGQRGVM